MTRKAAGIVFGIATTLIASMALAQSSSPFSGLFGGGDDPATSWPVALDYRVTGQNGAPEDSLLRQIRNTSLIEGALKEGRASGQDVLAAARGDYARILGLLFDAGYFGPVVNITLDGIEAASVAPLDAPANVQRVVVTVQTGPSFQFAQADIAPLAPGTELPRDYATGHTAGTGTIKQAAQDGIEAWRQAGHAKADLHSTKITAEHRAHLVYADVRLDPGPSVRFGRLIATGNERLRRKRLYEIAGFPEGIEYDPDQIEMVRKRLRRSGIFSAVTLEEAELLGPGNTLDVNLTVVEQKKRRAGVGIELSNTDGGMVSGYWLHRNMWGGGERLRLDAKVSDIGAQNSGRDYSLGFRIERPATFTPDITAFVAGGISRLSEEDSDSDNADFGIGITHFRSEYISSEVMLQYRWSRVKDDNGRSEFRLLALPGTVTWDRRDSQTDPRKGFWLKGDATPFAGLDGATDSGLRLVIEGRAYRSFGDERKLTFATRARLGTIMGADLDRVPRDYLFYSGGGGSVRGQPFESLGVEVLSGPNGPIKTGGMSVANLTAEMRFQVRGNIGMAVFADAGKVWTEGRFGGGSDWHAGAGVGLRFLTPIGPLRFDVAGPVAGDTGNGLQLYLGLGQAF